MAGAVRHFHSPHDLLPVACMSTLRVGVLTLLLLLPASAKAQRAGAATDTAAVANVVRALFAAAERGDLAALD